MPKQDSPSPPPAVRRLRLFAPILVLMLALTALIWGGLHYKADSEEALTVRSINVENLNLARAFEEHTIRTLKSVDQALLFLKYQYEKYGDKVNVADYVKDGVIISGLFNQLGVIDEKGIYILSNLPQHKRMDLSDREHFRVHRERDSNELFISKPVLGRASGKWSIQMTRRINKPDGSFGGVVVISVDPLYFSDFYSSVELGKEGVVALVGRDGVVRARRSGDNKQVGQDLSGGTLMALWAKSPSGIYRGSSVSDGRRRFYSYRAVQGYPLAVAVGVGEDEALAEWHARRQGYRLYAGGMTLVVLLFGAIAIRLLDRQYRIAAALQESQVRAEAANRMKSAFLASMSHELRTPLNGILGYAELLRDASHDENREFAEIILSSGQHLLDVVNDVLDLAKIEAGRMALAVGREALAPMLERILRTHLPRAREKGLQLDLCLLPRLPEEISCDVTKLTQILDNLLGNAIKFTDAGRVTLSVGRAGRMLRFAVKDSGCGIAAEQLAQIFERFSQVDGFLTRRHEGTGLGLALVKELVTLMGGSVSVTSEPGAGSEFVLHLPLAESPPAPAADAPQAPA